MTETDFWSDDAQRLNCMGERARTMGITIPVLPVENRSFFADCERDERGYCEGEGQSHATHKELLAVQRVARAKIAAAPIPTEAEANDAVARIEAHGNDKYRKATYGNSTDRAKSRAKLLAEFGDGKTCPCVYCGLKLTDATVTRDHIYTLREGGKYRQNNLLPACLTCNSRRQDVEVGSIRWRKSKR